MFISTTLVPFADATLHVQRACIHFVCVCVCWPIVSSMLVPMLLFADRKIANIEQHRWM